MEEQESKQITKMNLFEKMSNITNEVEKVAKKLKVGTGSTSYKAVAEADVLEAVKEKEYKYRVYSYPKDRVLKDQQIIKRIVYDKDNNPKESYTFYSKIETTYCFVNIDKPEDQIETKVFSEGIDTGDKGSGKAITYADKYSLLKAYKIETGDDPDKTPSLSENDEIEFALEEALEFTFTFGQYKGEKVFDVYLDDKQYIEYLINGKTPNQRIKACYDLFEEMPATKLKKIAEECNSSLDTLLTKCGVKNVYELNETQIAEAMETMLEFKKKKEQAKNNTENLITNSMLEDAENSIKEGK